MLGQTKATTINYLKNIRSLMKNVLRSFIHEDPTFPRGFDESPCAAMVTKIRFLEQKLDLVYTRKTKEQPGELFRRKAEEARNMPDYSDVVASISQILRRIPDNLVILESHFKTSVGAVNVRSEKNGTPDEKRVSVFDIGVLFFTSLTVFLFSRYQVCGGE